MACILKSKNGSFYSSNKKSKPKNIRVYIMLDEDGERESFIKYGELGVLHTYFIPYYDKYLPICKFDNNNNVYIALGSNLSSYEYDKISDIKEEENKFDELEKDKYIYKFNDGTSFIYLQNSEGGIIEDVIKTEDSKGNTILSYKFYNKKYSYPFEIEGNLINELDRVLDKYLKARKEEKEFIENINRIKKEEELRKEKEEYNRQLDESHEKLQINLWIKNNGSIYLKNAYKYKCNIERIYAMERAAKEYPDYVLDYNKCASWEEDVLPSPSLLKELKTFKSNRLKSFVGKIITPPDNIFKGYEEFDWIKFNKREELDYLVGENTIITTNYLGKYTLIKVK